MSGSFEVRIAFELDDDFSALTDQANELAGMECHWSGAGSGWAGCGMRDMGWSVTTFDEAVGIRDRIVSRFPDWKHNIREAI